MNSSTTPETMQHTPVGSLCSVQCHKCLLQHGADVPHVVEGLLRYDLGAALAIDPLQHLSCMTKSGQDVEAADHGRGFRSTRYFNHWGEVWNIGQYICNLHVHSYNPAHHQYHPPTSLPCELRSAGPTWTMYHSRYRHPWCRMLPTCIHLVSISIRCLHGDDLAERSPS